jgi:hypothetical protein
MLAWQAVDGRVHNRAGGRSHRMSERLDMGPDVVAVLRPDEAAWLQRLRDSERLRCTVCRRWIEPGSDDPVSVSISIDGAGPLVHFAHGGCGPSRADLAALVTVARADPQGIEYAQALHPDAGAVLVWERKLDVRVRGPADLESLPYLDAERWAGFHRALQAEPVRSPAGWSLEPEGEDMLLIRGETPVERFYDAAARPPAGWLEALRESGFALLIVGARMDLERPRVEPIQRAIRAGHALMGLVELNDQ